MMTTFDPTTHTYFNAFGEQLMSVTEAIKKYIQPNLYKGVPDAVIDHAAERGRIIHEAIDRFEKGNAFGNTEYLDELAAYCNYSVEHPRVIEGTEVMLSDERIIAGTVDQIEKISVTERAIADLKTTSAVNTEYLQWQLSLYAYLYELTNPAHKVTKLYCIHIRGNECKRVDIDRLPDYAVHALLKAIEEKAEHFDNPMKASNEQVDALVNQYLKLSVECTELEEVLKLKKEHMDAILEELKQRMDKLGQTEIKTKGATITRTKDSSRKTFNKELFLKKYTEADYNACLKETPITGKCKIKFDLPF